MAIKYFEEAATYSWFVYTSRVPTVLAIRNGRSIKVTEGTRWGARATTDVNVGKFILAADQTFEFSVPASEINELVKRSEKA